MITFDMGRIMDGQMYASPYRRFAYWQGREDILQLANQFFDFVNAEGWTVVRDGQGNYALSDGSSTVDGYQSVTAEQMALHMALLWLQRLEEKLKILQEARQDSLPQ